MLYLAICSTLALGMASGTNVVRYEAVEDATAAKAFVNRESKGSLPALTCAAKCNQKNRTWPLQQCNAYARDPLTGDCEIGSYDHDYDVQPGDEAVGKDTFTANGEVCHYC